MVKHIYINKNTLQLGALQEFAYIIIELTEFLTSASVVPHKKAVKPLAIKPLLWLFPK
jgi:hypothetical protein